MAPNYNVSRVIRAASPPRTNVSIKHPASRVEPWLWSMLMLLLVIMVKCRFACYGTRSSSGLCCFQLFLLLHVSTWKRELQKMSECSERKLIKELFQSSSFLFYTGSPPDLKVGWGTQLLFHRDLDNSQCEECKDFSALGSLEAGSNQINEQCII